MSRAIAEAWARALAATLPQTGDEPWNVTTQAVAEPATDLIWYRCAAAEGTVWFGAPGDVIDALALVEEPNASDAREACARLWQRAANAAGGGEISESAAPAGGSTYLMLQLSHQATQFTLWTAIARPAAAATAVARTMDVLMDVEMPVSISFGETSMMMRDVLKLGSGAVLDLNRSADALVDIVVNNCVIARGEVVNIDGQYGIRVREIISPKERLNVHQQFRQEAS